MPRVLSESDVAEFRGRLCEEAARLFAEHGPEAVTMRQLASALGVSPMTPYRYFKDKDEILAAVRANGFNRFADALEAAYAKAGSARAKGAAVGEAYLDFAFGDPATYKLMFDLDQPNVSEYPDLVAALARARETMSHYVRGLVESGDMAGEPTHIGQMFWAATHGSVVLELAGKLPPGSARKISGDLISTLAKGLKA